MFNVTTFDSIFKMEEHIHHHVTSPLFILTRFLFFLLFSPTGFFFHFILFFLKKMRKKQAHKTRHQYMRIVYVRAHKSSGAKERKKKKRKKRRNGEKSERVSEREREKKNHYFTSRPTTFLIFIFGQIHLTMTTLMHTNWCMPRCLFRDREFLIMLWVEYSIAKQTFSPYVCLFVCVYVCVCWKLQNQYFFLFFPYSRRGTVSHTKNVCEESFYSNFVYNIPYSTVTFFSSFFAALPETWAIFLYLKVISFTI
jgi:hypothetical protein